MENYNKNEPGPFYGRIEELEDLERAYSSNRSELWVVYGRRRVGKTELLRRFAHGKRAFFFTGGREPLHDQTRRFLSELADFSGQGMLRKLRGATWTDALSALEQQLALSPKKTLVVLDEFQWMCQGSLGAISDIQRLWDHRWKAGKHLHLILCGSAESFMTGEVLAQKSPLFGRRTASLRLEPLTASEGRGFFVGRSLFEIAEALMCLGGVPAYLELFENASSVRKRLSDLAFSKGGYLTDEADHVFGEQLREKERYYEIVGLLAAEPTSLAGLARATGLNKGQLNYYLERLLALGFVEKHRPITKTPRSKTIRYRLLDEYLRFYFTFIQPNLSKIRLQRKGYQFDRITAGTWDVFVGLAFEQLVARNISALLSAIEARDVVSRLGSYWHGTTKKRRGVQIDLVIERDDGVTHLVECKWSKKPIGRRILSELEAKRNLYPNPRGHTLEPVLVASAGATRAVLDSGLHVVTLEELFAGK